MRYLSLSGGSGLGMSTLLECPRKFELIKDGWRPRQTQLYFIEGQIFHRYAERKLLGEKVDLREAEKLILSGEMYDEFKEETLTWDTKKMATKKQTEVQQAASRCANMLWKLSEAKDDGKFGEIKEENVEQLIECDLLVDLETGEISDDAKMLHDEGIIFVCRLDVSNDAVHDIKTGKFAKLKPEQKDELDHYGYLEKWGKHNAQKAFQLTEYAYMKSIKEQKLCEEVWFHMFSKHITDCEYVPLKGTRTYFDFKRAHDMMIRTGKIFLDCEVNGYHPEGMIRSDCSDMYGQECKFWDHCRGGVDLVDQEEFEQLSVKGEYDADF